MGTDRDEIGAGACPCGKGTITVDSCSPDHPWGGGHWYEARLHCAGCSKTHAIFDNHGGKPTLVLRSDVAKKEAAAAAWHAKIKAIEATSEYKSAKALVEKMVSQQPSDGRETSRFARSRPQRQFYRQLQEKPSVSILWGIGRAGHDGAGKSELGTRCPCR
jgi:hypothetical protein